MTAREDHIRLLAVDINEALQLALNTRDADEALRLVRGARAVWFNLAEVISLGGEATDGLMSIRYLLLGGTDPFGVALNRDDEGRRQAIVDLQQGMQGLMDVLDNP